MGMNIIFSNHDTYDEHPEWDSCRRQGDSEFPEFCEELPRIDHPRMKEIFDRYDQSPFRPGNFQLWRQAIRKSKLPYRARFLKLMALCEQNPDYWISFIY